MAGHRHVSALHLKPRFEDIAGTHLLSRRTGVGRETPLDVHRPPPAGRLLDPVEELTAARPRT